MPQIPTYIRQADWDKYIAIQSKGGWPEFIHNALNPELDFSEVDTSTAAVEYGSLKPDPSDSKPIKTVRSDMPEDGQLKKIDERFLSKPIKNPKTIGVPDMFSRVELVEPMEEKIVDGVKMKGADTTKGYYLEAEVIKTPARKALKPLEHVTYFKKGKK